jgi:hypothetical protein
MSDNLDQIRFITANYSRLQGLRSVPVGIFISLAGIWSNLPAGQDGDLAAPLLMMVLGIVVYIAIDRYYARTFGQVTQTSAERTREIITAVFFGLLAFVSFIFDTSETLPISTLGLVFAAGMLMDLWRVGRHGKNGQVVYPEAVTGAALITIASLLPLAGFQWWQLLGMKTSPAGLLLLVGMVMVLIGLFGHFRFIRSLKKLEEGIHA